MIETRRRSRRWQAVLSAARPVLTPCLVVTTCLAVAPEAVAGQVPLASGSVTGTVTGTVVEAESGRPVGWASVELVREGESEPVVETATDRNGRYRVPDLAPGWYRLTVTGLGYRLSRLWVELPDSRRIERSLGLELEPVALHAVRVRVGRTRGAWPGEEAAPRARALGTTAFGVGGDRPALDAEALSSRDIEDVPALGEPDILRALQGLPGASAQGDFSAGLWTRGSPWGMTRVLLDGLPIFHPLHLGGTLSGMSPEGLDAALFLPGVRPAALSEGASGTVNLVTRRASPGGSRSTGVTPVAVRSHVEDRLLDDRLGLWVTGRRSWWDVVSPPRLFAGEAASSGAVDYWFADVSGRADLELGDRGLVEAGGLWEEDRIDGEVMELVRSSHGRWGNRVGWLALSGARESLRGRILVGRTVHESTTRPDPSTVFFEGRRAPPLDHNELRLARSLLRLEAGDTPGGRFDWALGLDRARQTLRQFGQAAVDRGAPGTEGEATLDWIRVWAQGSWRLGPLTTSGGAGWNPGGAGTDNGRGLAVYNASLRLRVTEGLVVEGARGTSRQLAYTVAPAGRSFGPGLSVHPVWTMAVDGRPPLESDLSTASARLELSSGFGGRVTAWGRIVDGVSMEGVSAVVDGRLVPVYLDGLEGRERGKGVEVALWRRTGPVRGEISYSRGRSTMEAPSGETWPSPSDRTHSLDGLLSIQASPTTRVGGVLRYESGWPWVLGPWLCPERDGPDDCVPLGDPLRPTEYSVHRAPSYRSFDLAVDWWRPGERVTWAVHASVRNLFGADNREAYRPEGCLGAEVVSLSCESAMGVGRFAPGLTRPTPALAVRAYF